MRDFSPLNFSNTEIAFKAKSSFELKRMYLLFTIINNPIFTKIGVSATLLAMKLKLPIHWIIKKLIFTQFCGGISLEDSLATTAERLSQSNIKTILDYSVENSSSEAVFDANKDEIFQSLNCASQSTHIPTGVMKLTALTSFDLLAKKQAKEKLTAQEFANYNTFLERVDQLCAKAVVTDTSLFVDAEESWIQLVIDEVVNTMMMKYNQAKVYIFNTYQMYQVASLQKIKHIHERGQKEGFKVGAKLVRGAYMEIERARAEKMNYADPIQPDKQASDSAYDAAVAYCIENINQLHLCVGTHNEKSCQLTAQMMQRKGLERNDPKVYFAQLFGMSDNLSYVLAHQGYNVAKYVPYGSIDKVIPYLMRRAKENTSITGQTSRQLLLIKQEITRRDAQRSVSK